MGQILRDDFLALFSKLVLVIVIVVVVVFFYGVGTAPLGLLFIYLVIDLNIVFKT